MAPGVLCAREAAGTTAPEATARIMAHGTKSLRTGFFLMMKPPGRAFMTRPRFVRR
jgi:hypothetical protein